MDRVVGLLTIIGFFSFITPVNSQTQPPSTPETAFDGTYAFVSSTKVNETYMDRAGQIGHCPDLRASSLIITKGQASLPLFEGTVGPHGELAMQTPSPSTANTQFDGRYVFVSSARLSETYMSVSGRVGQCREAKRMGTLSVVNGKAQYPDRIGEMLEGTVGSQGELAMRFAEPVSKSSDPAETVTHGKIDGNGAVSARQITRWCSYDLIWQKVVEGTVSGRVDKDGKVKARRTVNGCSYDTIWQKEVSR